MKTSKKNLALLELIIVILFFAMSAVVLTQVFVKAKAMGDISSAQTTGLVAAEDIAERLMAKPWDAGGILTGWSNDGDKYTAQLGEDMRMPAENPVYTATVDVQPQSQSAGTLYKIDVDITRINDGHNIINIETGRYVPETEVRQ